MKTKVIGLRLTPEDAEKLQKMTIELGFYHPSDWLRSVIREYRSKKQDNVAIFTQIAEQKYNEGLEGIINPNEEPKT